MPRRRRRSAWRTRPRSTHRRARLHEKNERIEVGFEVMCFGMMSFGVMGVAVMGVVVIGVAGKGVVHLKI